MEEPVPTPPELASIVRLYQRMEAFDNTDPLNPIRTDGELDARTIQTLDKTYPINQRLQFTPSVLRKSEDQSFAELWKNYTDAAKHFEEKIGRPYDPEAETLLILAPNKRQEALQAEFAYNALRSRLKQCEQHLITSYQEALELKLAETAQSAQSDRQLARIITVYADSDDLPAQSQTLTPALLAEAALVINRLDINSDVISDYWRERIPDIRDNITNNGILSLDGKYRLDADADGVTRIHYSFDPALDTAYERLEQNSIHATKVGPLPEAQRALFRESLSEYSAVAQLEFIEVKNSAFPESAKTRWQVHDATFSQPTLGCAEMPRKYDGVSTQNLFINVKAHEEYDASVLYATMLHEAGHGLGLKHPFTQETTNAAILNRKFDTPSFTQMSYREGIQDGLGPMDVATMQYMYQPSAHNTGNTRYNLRDDAAPRVIHDTKGRNTIDASSLTGEIGVNIDLTDDVYDARKPAMNLRVTEGTHIEQVIGSPKDDIIYSGTKQHRLNGNGGKDKFVIPETGMHFIEKFNPESGDTLELPQMNNWQARTLKDGTVYLRGLRYNEQRGPVEILIQPEECTTKSLMEYLKPQLECQYPSAMLQSINKTALKDAIKGMQRWANDASPISDETAEISLGSASRINAKPITPNTKER